METINPGRKIRGAGEEEDVLGSALQLQLAASVITSLAKRNGGCGAANVFWEEDSVDSDLDQGEYLDPELWDPDEEETVPEMAIINENIFGGL